MKRYDDEVVTVYQINEGKKFGEDLSGLSKFEADLVLIGLRTEKLKKIFTEKGFRVGDRVKNKPLPGEQERTGVISRLFPENANASVYWDTPIVGINGKTKKVTQVGVSWLEKY